LKPPVLLNPGPVNVTPRVRDALLRGDMCHREVEFSDLMAAIRQKLLKAFDIEDEYTSVLVSGSGTAALEMGVSSCLSPGKSMLIIQNGVYGERIAKIADIYKFPKHVLNYEWGQPPSMEDIENALKEHPDIEVVALVHHETTTGLLNPLKAVGDLSRKYKKKFFVDCISSLAGDEVDFITCSIDFAIGTANKCIQGLPGVAFVFFRKKDLCRLNYIPDRSLYFNLLKYHGAQEAGDTMFTPAIQIHYALDEALDELLEETVQGRIRRYKTAAGLFRKGFSEMGLDLLIPEGHRSNCLTALRLPEGIDYSGLHARLKSQGFVIYAGQGNLQNKIFRIANMGDLQKEDIATCLQVLKESCSQIINEE
jgi:2-aminoethylphosphonate-pyruvate transaminase